ncbi:MAG: VirB4 family type IV secretion/conjugal transfer ATPase [Nitrospira sp.]|nr:VirB4 family type IV secretion/conjugal transfer ATPase [Nitrospira sp.]MBS0194372.1 VirB4 family type IV secretion/conjugal transfer ATPase [Pseudomonadota bacterium]
MPAEVKPLMSNDLDVSRYVPYTIHSTEHNVRTDRADVCTVIHVAGAAHEAADDDDIQSWHEVLCGLIRNLSSERVAIYAHTLREPRNEYPGGVFDDDFAGRLNDKYRASLSGARMMVNSHYLTLVLRGPSVASRLLNFGVKKTRDSVAEAIAEADSKLDELADTVIAALSRHGARRVGLYNHNGAVHSEALEFLATLVNGEWQRMPVSKGQVKFTMATSRISFGVDQLEIRTPTTRKIGAVLAVNDYQVERSEPGHLNLLLTLPFPYALTQSFAILPRKQALDWMLKQQRLLINAGDAGQSQIADISAATDDLVSNRIVFGDHHLSLLVLADNPKQLAQRIAQARAALSESGFVVAREDSTMEAAYWAQLPGNLSLRPRPAPISSRNFIGFTGFHNYPNGKVSGNQWGPAVTLLKTTSGTPYYFNFHLPTSGRKAQDERDVDARVPGHALLLGPTGAGKTVIQTFMLAQCEKFRPTVFTFDKDRGQEIFIRAMGGRYATLRNGHPTGFNPCTLPDTPGNRDLLQHLVKKCVGGNLSPSQEREIAEAVAGIYGMEYAERRFLNMMPFFDPTDPDGVAQRFRKWVSGGSLHWVFDNEIDLIGFDNTRHYGFDMTDFLDNEEILTPAVMYLFHRMESLIDGRRFVLNMDEFWKMLKDPYFEAKALDAVKTYRKRNAFALFGTQSPADVLSSSISKQLIEQVVTQLYLPNPKARREDYLDGFNLTEREYEIVRHDMVENNLRGFLLKQGANSTVCELNLRGFEDELAVLSGTAATVELCERAVASAGIDPEKWLPMFQQLRRSQ